MLSSKVEKVSGKVDLVSHKVDKVDTHVGAIATHSQLLTAMGLPSKVSIQNMNEQM